MLTAFFPAQRPRTLRRAVHVAAPFFLLSYWPLFLLLLCDPDGLPSSPAAVALIQLLFWVLSLGICLCLAGSALFLGQDLKIIYQNNRVPVLDLLLDAWPIVLTAVFFLHLWL
ncbi:MAG: hypothetical protein PUH00_06225 [Clostridiales bacterium]|nr:hypothetical protein [Clostridiales bacterium]